MNRRDEIIATLSRLNDYSAREKSEMDRLLGNAERIRVMLENYTLKKVALMQELGGLLNESAHL